MVGCCTSFNMVADRQTATLHVYPRPPTYLWWLHLAVALAALLASLDKLARIELVECRAGQRTALNQRCKISNRLGCRIPIKAFVGWCASTLYTKTQAVHGMMQWRTQHKAAEGFGLCAQDGLVAEGAVLPSGFWTQAVESCWVRLSACTAWCTPTHPMSRYTRAVTASSVSRVGAVRVFASAGAAATTQVAGSTSRA